MRLEKDVSGKWSGRERRIIKGVRSWRTCWLPWWCRSGTEGTGIKRLDERRLAGARKGRAAPRRWPQGHLGASSATKLVIFEEREAMPKRASERTRWTDEQPQDDNKQRTT
eukprot:scaffold13717_cov132-Isochrysis_galbana.AAC.2